MAYVYVVQPTYLIRFFEKFTCLNCKNQNLNVVIGFSISSKGWRRTKPSQFPNQDSFLCKECGKTFAKRNSFKAHTTRHDRRNKGVRFTCDVCGLLFLDKKSVELHKRNLHLNDYPFCCDQCGKAFVSRGVLNRHIKMAHGQTSEPVLMRCTFDDCPEVFRCRSTLKYHLVKHELKTYGCEYCLEVFRHPHRLKVHIRKHHGGKMKALFSCHLCSKQVTTKLSLRDHLRIHTGEKPFVCEWCGQSFATSQYLKVHRVVHTKEKPHACQVCGRGFTQRSSLKCHVRSKHALA